MTAMPGPMLVSLPLPEVLLLESGDLLSVMVEVACTTTYLDCLQ